MAQSEHDHGALFARAMEQVSPLFEQSGQAMFLWMDEENAACNARFAKMLGFRTPADWAKAVRSGSAEFFDPATRASNVRKVSAALGAGNAIQLDVVWLDRKGKKVPSSAIVVPYDVEGHRCALNFITPK